MKVRRAQPADLDAILAIAGQSPEAPQWGASRYVPFLNADPGAGASGLSTAPLLRTAVVVEAGETIFGFAAASLLLDGEENRCELESMAVLPTARRQGAGTALLEAVRGWAAGHGARHLVLEVRAGNTAALRLYEGFGLRVTGCRPRYYRDPEEDALLLGMAVTTVQGENDFSTRKSVEGGRPQC